MPFLGFGSAPIGNVGFGVGQAFGLNSNAGKLYLDDQGAQKNAAAISPSTGDLVRNPETGFHGGVDSVSQMVYLAMRTVRDSSVVRNFGFAFKFRLINESTAQKLQDAANEALSDLVLRGLIEIVSITVDRAKPTALKLVLIWRNLTNGETNTQEFTL